MASRIGARATGLFPGLPKRRWRRLGAAASVTAVAAAGSLLLAWAGFEIALSRLPPPRVEIADDVSTTVLDRQGRLLRAYTTEEDLWRLPVTHRDVDPRYLELLLAFEDRRFHDHGGVDLLALARAGVQMAVHGRIVSGASTLTMQTVRLLERDYGRSLSTKVLQILRAVQLERGATKGEILDLYLRLAPFGGNIEGVRAASLAYFGKEPSRLSVAQAALLVALPQSPEARRPDRSAAEAKAARRRVLTQGVLAGVITQAEADRAAAEPVPRVRRAFPMLAPHLADAELARAPGLREHRLTLDRRAQRSLEDLIVQRAEATGPRLSAALIAVDHTTGEVIAQVGSPGYLDASRFGAIDMTTAVRSPGSTLKPIIYGLAFERGLAHPETLIEDRPARFGGYRPENFDEGYRGTVTIREALQQSLNVPAVRVLDRLGPDHFVGRLRNSGLSPALPDGARPNLAVALGGFGLTLRDLAQLYAGLAQGGRYVGLHHRLGEADRLRLTGEVAKSRAKALLDPVAAWYVTDILKGAPAPDSARSGQIAYKTGTSYGYRDAFAVGYDGRYAIAVWVGRPDGASTPGLIGRVAAAPILFDAFQRLSESRAPFALKPAGTFAGKAADLPPNLKRFERSRSSGHGDGAFREEPIAIVFPPDRAEVEIGGRSERYELPLKAEGGALPLTWLIDGHPLKSDGHRRQAAFLPGGPGFVKVAVIDAQGRVDRVTVRLSE